jgi:pimeloyl-ACP methyl ester carboxylesterase
LQHLGAGLKAIVNNRQMHYTANRFNRERDSRVLVLACLIGRKSPRQNKTVWRGNFHDLSYQIDTVLFFEVPMLPSGAWMPVGHRRTADIDRPLRFELMADDIAALMKHLGIEKADFMGYSLGGGVILQIAIRHPDVIHRLVLVSTPIKRIGWYPEVLENMAQMGPQAAKFMKQSSLNQLYPEADWTTLFTKLGDLLRQNYDWSKDVATIKAPMMIVFADADAVRTAHVMEFF